MEVGGTFGNRIDRRIQWWQREGLKSAFKTLNHHVPGDEEGETNCSAVHLWSLQCMRSSPLVTAVNVNVVSFSNLEETKKSNGKLASPKAIWAEVSCCAGGTSSEVGSTRRIQWWQREGLKSR